MEARGAARSEAKLGLNSEPESEDLRAGGSGWLGGAANYALVCKLAKRLLGSGRIRRNYTVARTYYALLYGSRSLLGASPLVIYQMGKVGSSTLWRSLAPFDLGRPAFRVHSLTPEHLEDGLGGVGMSAREYYEQRSTHDLVGRYLRRELERARGRDRWKVITLVRDPLAQNVSSFFQLLDLRAPELLERHRSGTLQMQDLLARYLEDYPPDCIFNRWFEAEMGAVFGLDVFADPFPWDQGYRIYQAADADVLVLRLEDMDRCGGEVMREFLGLEGFRVIPDNVGDDKGYADLYRDFQARAQLPVEYVDAVYGSRLVQHFYSPAEVESFAARWQRPGSGA